HHSDCAQRERDSHSGFSHHRAAMAAPNIEILQPATADCGCCVDGVVEASNSDHAIHREMSSENQVAGQPGDHEIKKIVACEMAESGAPEGTLLKDLPSIDRRSRRIRSGIDVSRFPLRPGWEPEQADQSNTDEHGTPTVPSHQIPGPECSDGVAGAQCGHEGAAGESAIVLRQTASENL